MQMTSIPRTRHFNPHAPRGARPGGQCKEDRGAFISIHTPLAGRDVLPKPKASVVSEISIHTPLAGRDR